MAAVGLDSLPSQPLPIRAVHEEITMTVAARFFVSSIGKQSGSTANHVQLGAVCRGAANSEWSSATPAGSISMHIRNDAAFEQFEQGAEYEVTFRKIEKPVEGDGHSVQAFRPSYSSHLQCGVCGFYPAGDNGPDATPESLDWSKHDEHFGARG